MSTAFFFHEKFSEHDAGPLHPENPERLRAIIQGLKDHNLWDRLIRPLPVAALPAHIQLAHTEQHYKYILDCSRRGSVQIDPDTRVSAASADSASIASGAAIEAVSAIMGEQYSNAFAAVRPPGHHATADRAMGFCLFNHIAIAARYLISNYNLQRVLIVDWDVHHGNGTQDIFYDDPAVIYVSLHRENHYPGTGWPHQEGAGNAKGTIINYPLNTTDPVKYEAVFGEALQRAEPFRPEFVLVSCGFDAHERDPLGTLGLKDETYGRITETLLNWVSQFGHRRVFSILEGGYDYTALANAAAAHVKALLDRGE